MCYSYFWGVSKKTLISQIQELVQKRDMLEQDITTSQESVKQARLQIDRFLTSTRTKVSELPAESMTELRIRHLRLISARNTLLTYMQLYANLTQRIDALSKKRITKTYGENKDNDKLMDKIKKEEEKNEQKNQDQQVSAMNTVKVINDNLERLSGSSILTDDDLNVYEEQRQSLSNHPSLVSASNIYEPISNSSNSNSNSDSLYYNHHKLLVNNV